MMLCPLCGSEVKIDRKRGYGYVDYRMQCANEGCFLNYLPSFDSKDELQKALELLKSLKERAVNE